MAEADPASRVARAAPRAGRWLAGIAAAAAVVNLPLLLVGGLFADDWTWFHLYWTAGPGALLDAMVAVAHPLYGPWFVAAFALGAGWARAASLALHLLNGFLLFRVLRRPVPTRRLAPLAAAIFLLSPFYAARGMLAHTQYDLFLAAWLVSVVWMTARARWKRIAAPVAMALAMGLEPLMMLEPLRLLFAWQNERRPAALARRLAPFWVIAAATVALRFTAFAPSGHYAGARRVSLAPGALVEHLGLGFAHLPASIALAAWEAAYALPWFLLALVVAAAAASCWRGVGGAPPATRSTRATLLALVGAAALVAAGALPYALTGDHAWPTRFESRFAFVSNVGAVIGLATLIAWLPRATWRRAAAWAALTLFALGQLGDGKWLVLDARIQANLQADILVERLNQAMANEGPRLVRLEITPPSNRTLYRFRCLGAADLNVASDLGYGAPRTFVYETMCGDWERLAAAGCTVTYLDRQPCPAGATSRAYRIPDEEIWTAVTIWQALFRPRATVFLSPPMQGPHCTAAQQAVASLLEVPTPLVFCVKP